MGFSKKITNASNHAKCISLNNQQCMTQPTLINLNPHEHNQRLCSYPFAVNLYRCFRSCIILMIYLIKNFSELNIHVFDMITEINESKIQTK